MKAFTIGLAIGTAALAAGIAWLWRAEHRWLQEVR